MADFKDTRVSEKRFYAIPVQALTANGTTDGTITIANTYCWKVGQIITCVSTTVTPRQLKIKAVLSETVIKVGETNTPIFKFTNVSNLLTADTATIELHDDKIANRRPTIDITEINRQVYEEEPTVAWRMHSVDWLGRSYSSANPMPVQLSDGDINIGTVNAEIEVQLSHQDNVPDAGDIADSVQIGDGTAIAKVDVDNRSFSTNRYEKLLPFLANAKWLELTNYESSSISSAGSVDTITYLEGGSTVAKAIFTFTDDQTWSYNLEAYINDDDGSILDDDDDTPLFLD